MEEKELRRMLENLQGTIRQTNPDEDSLRERLGRMGETGTLGAVLASFADTLLEAGESGRDRLMEELTDAELAVRERHPGLADAIRTAIKILENAGI